MKELENSAKESESLVIESKIFFIFFPSSIKHVEFCVNLRGPPRKAKYS